jgi:hypothetical protein
MKTFEQGELFSSLPPMSHPTIPGAMRVPLHEMDGVYELHIEERYIRRYTDENLPDKVKVALAFIKAASPHPFVGTKFAAPRWASNLNSYINSMGESYDSIGWRSPHQVPHGEMYMIVLPRKYMFSLVGERIKKGL